MNIDLSADIRKSLHDALARAKKHYDVGEDAKAAAAYEGASRLALKLAEGAPDRAAEIAGKKEAMKYRDYAKRLSAGEVPPVAERSAPPESGASGLRPQASGVKTDATSPRPASSSGIHVATRGPRPEARGPAARGDERTDDDGKMNSAVAALVTSSPVTWDQIGGLEDTKREIKYALALSIAKAPAGVSIPTWRNVLFYGPPGTGKTLLAAATSNAIRLNAKDETRAVFFNVKVSSVMSKYFGESTRIVSELYGQARDASPAVVFLDEFESLAGSRDQDDSGAERRILSTLLSELDGLAEKGRKDIYVLTVAATNRPWDLDAAVLSRFEKKILIPLPDADTRRAILGILIRKRGFLCEVDDGELVAMTEGYSGREIERFVKEVTTRMIAETNASLPALVDRGLDEVRSYEVRVRPLRRDELEAARRRISPQTTKAEMDRYLNWKESEAV
jgi:AAA+ superfamily predicted ATPase